MLTDEVISPKSRENLAWFQNRKERWIKSPRPKLKPIPTHSQSAKADSSPADASSSNNKAEPSDIKGAPETERINDHTPLTFSSSTDRNLVAPVPSKPKTNLTTEGSSAKKTDTTCTKGIFANINLVSSTSLAPTSSNVGTTSLPTFGVTSGPTSFKFGTTTTSTTETTSLPKETRTLETKETASNSIFGVANKATTFGLSSGPSPFAVATNTNTLSTTAIAQKATSSFGQDKSVSNSIFGGDSNKQVPGVSSDSMKNPFTFGATKITDSTSTTSGSLLLGGSTKPSFGISASPSPFTTGSVFGGNKTTTPETQPPPKDTNATTTTTSGITNETTSPSIFGSGNTTFRSSFSNQTPFSFGNKKIAVDSASTSEQPATADQPSSSSSSNDAPKATGSQLESSTNTQGGNATTSDPKSRLIAFYQKYNPEKLDSVDATLEKYKGNEEDLFKKLEAKYLPPPASKYPLPSGEGPVCFLEFSIDGEIAGKVTVKLYRNQVPLACDNFQGLCNGSKGKGRMGKLLCYKNSKVHRVVPLFCVQMGDFTRGDGTGGESIYEPSTTGVSDSMGRFKDETFLQHSKKGLLSMANNGPDRNGSQFFFTLRPCPSLDGKHVVFGEVVTGMDVIERIGKLKTTPNQRPEQSVEISDCGEIVDGKEVACQVALEKASTPFSFGATTFGNGLGESNSIGFGSLAASAQASNVVGFGSSSGGTSAFSFGAVASSLQSSSNDKASGSGFSSIATKPASFGFPGTNAGSTTTPTFGGGNTMSFAALNTKSSFGFGSTSSVFGKQDGPSSAFSFGSMSLTPSQQSATSQSAVPTQSLKDSPGFAFRAESKEGSESDDSSRDDNGDDSDDDE